MARKSTAELKAEGADLGILIANARKRPLNFALLIAKEGVVLEAHLTKGADVMRRQAKANGGGPRGIQGLMNVVGKRIEFTSEDDDVPSTLAKATKRHLKDCGLFYQVVILLPSGEQMTDGESDDDDLPAADDPAPEPQAEDQPTAEGTKPVELPESIPETPDPKAELTARIKKLIPEVKALVAQKAEGADQLARGLQAAGAELAKAGYDRASQLLTAVEKGVGIAKPASPAVDTDALRLQLKAEFSELTAGLEDLKSRAGKGVAGKAAQLGVMFDSVVAGDDLKKAAAVLSLIRSFVATELGKLAETTGGILDRLGDAASELAQEAKDMLDKGLEAADDLVDSLTEDGRKKLDLQALGFSETDQDRLVAELATNPNAIKAAKDKLVEGAGLPPTESRALKKLAETDPKAFAAALETLRAMGAVEVSAEALQTAILAQEAARKAQAAAVLALAKANSELATIKGGTPLPGSDWAAAVAAADAAQKAFLDFGKNLPEPAQMNETERKEAMLKGMQLDGRRKAAAAAVIEAKAAAEAAAETALTTASSGVTRAESLAMAGQKDLAAREAKRGLLDAIAFGRLSPGATPAFKDADKASFIAGFAKDGALAASAMELAARSDDPSAIAQNLGMIADKVKDGFAAADGRRLDMPEGDLRKMAQNALRLGALQGDAYFKGFEAYLKSGKQLAPDPYGGLSAPLAEPSAETQRLNKIALSRTAGLAAAAIKDGKPEFDTPEAKAAMEHMMFHPGSLTAFTPQMTAKMAETKALFSDPATAAAASKVIADTRLPALGSTGRQTSAKIIGGTMGKTADAVTDDDAKAAVLSAMMTPLSQGPVGSCFSTAPVRAIRETEPLRAMAAFSTIASTGKFTSAQGKEYPANVNPPKGENPLMRSWEYSAATAAAELQDSVFRGMLNAALWPSPPSGTSLRGLKDIVGDGAWGSTTADNGLKIDGVRRKLSKAIRRQLRFEYNAGPKLDEATPSSGGDGKSTDGGYQIIFGGKAITEEAGFIAALEKIALAATGEKKGETKGDEIVALVRSTAFRDAILAAFGGNGTAPWNLPDGGVAHETARVLNGGTPRTLRVVQGNKPPAVVKSRADRTAEVLGYIMGKADPGGSKMEIISTFGENCNHSFSALPKHPSQDKIRDPDSAAKIRAELIEPGAKVAREEISVEEAASIYHAHMMGLAEGAAQDERDLLIAALKKAPKIPLTPAELKAAMAEGMKDFNAALAQKRADTWVAEKEPDANGPRKAHILGFFADRAKAAADARITDTLVNAIEVPEVVLADSNWGGPAGQTYFVARPDPISGELMMWEKDVFTGRLKPLGKNWEDASWNTVE